MHGKRQGVRHRGAWWGCLLVVSKKEGDRAIQVVWSAGDSALLMFRWLFLLRKSATPSIITLAVVGLGLTVGLVFLRLDRGPDEFLAVAALNYSTINYDKVNCLSIDPHKVVFDGTEYSDPELPESISNVLSIKNVLSNADFATCPWGFFVTAVPGTIFAVRYGVRPAMYLVSIGICERRADGRLNPDKCVNKNVYVFNWRVAPHELFSIGLIGLSRLQTEEWEAFKVRGMVPDIHGIHHEVSQPVLNLSPWIAKLNLTKSWNTACNE